MSRRDSSFVPAGQIVSVQGLEKDGIVVREPDPSDGRGRCIVYTARGLAALKDAAKVKQAIERGYRATLGDAAFLALRRALRTLVPPSALPPPV
jgi:DNA-binding MarR family transcriptional regulator